MLKNDLLLRAAQRLPVERVPVWMMRQAGRSDPAYRALREKIDLPLERLFRTIPCPLSDQEVEWAIEISLLPKRIGLMQSLCTKTFSHRSVRWGCTSDSPPVPS